MNQYLPHPQQQHSPQPSQAFQPQPQPQPPARGGGIGGGVAAPTRWDVLNGRGQGVQRHPGNVKYRTLVFANKGLYAKCPRSDKMKISKGIVAAVRELGGGFLEQDERTGAYFDIGDKKATEKTSQALREGQKKIRKQIYKEEEMMNAAANKQIQMSDVSLLGAGAALNAANGRGISAEGYFSYSVQLLESFGNVAEKKNDRPMAASADFMPDAGMPGLPPLPSAVKSDHSVAMAMDQFPGAAPSVKKEPGAKPYALPQPIKQELGAKPYETGMLPPPLPRQQPAAHPEMMHGFSTGGVAGLGRCLLSIDRMPGLAQGGGPKQAPTIGQRAVAKSVVSDEIRNLILMSAPQLKMVENGSLTKLVGGVEEAGGVSERKDEKDADAERALATKDAETDRASASMVADSSRDRGGEGTEGRRAVEEGKNMDDAQLLLRLSDGNV